MTDKKTSSRLNQTFLKLFLFFDNYIQIIILINSKITIEIKYQCTTKVTFPNFFVISYFGLLLLVTTQKNVYGEQNENYTVKTTNFSFHLDIYKKNTKVLTCTK